MIDQSLLETTLTSEIANLIVLIAVLWAIGWGITRIGRITFTKEQKCCANCFWIYNKNKVIFCEDPTPPFMTVNRQTIKHFRCGRWSKQSEK